MSYKDVREWIQRVDEMGELKVVEGAGWNLEIGALSVLASKHKGQKLIVTTSHPLNWKSSSGDMGWLRIPCWTA